MLGKLIASYCKLLSWLMVTCLALMVLLVFTNVVLRYAFNSGVTISEELSRWLFVWMTFLGAVVALHERAHLGTHTLVSRLSMRGKKICLGTAHLLMLWICALVLKGAWEQVKVNLGSTSAAMEASLALFYASGATFAVLGALVLIHDFLRLITGRLSEAELVGGSGGQEASHHPSQAA
jgi:TRAP-type C4-dicarboxylate transport system permease small subunit